MSNEINTQNIERAYDLGIEAAHRFLIRGIATIDEKDLRIWASGAVETDEEIEAYMVGWKAMESDMDNTGYNGDGY